MSPDPDASPLPPGLDVLRTARVVEWNAAKGFGFLDSEGGRVFLHRRDLKDPVAVPQPGDVVRFRMGRDDQGRPCAQGAVCRGAGWRRLRGQALLVLGLLVLPAAALIHQGLGHWLVAVYALVLSVITYQLYSRDKQAAQANQWRITELTLHTMAMLGGWPGGYLAQVRLRHKSAKKSFLIVFWGIVVVYQYVSLEMLLGWQITNAVWGAVSGSGK